MKQKLYLETTIPSYLVSNPSRDIVVAGHQEITRIWWKNRRKDFDIYISQFVIDEISAGDPVQSKKRLDSIASLSQLEITDEVLFLAQDILSIGIIPAKAATDAAHIAIASIHGMDYLMTWNCAHIANAAIFNSVKKVCIENGYLFPTICTPEELLGEFL